MLAVHRHPTLLALHRLAHLSAAASMKLVAKRLVSFNAKCDVLQWSHACLSVKVKFRRHVKAPLVRFFEP